MKKDRKIMGLIPCAIGGLGMGFIVRYYICLARIMAVKEGGAILQAALKLVAGSAWTYLIGFVFFLFFGSLYLWKPVRTGLYRFRYLIAGAFFLLMVLLGWSGSSAGYLCELYGVEDSDLLAGYSRIVRSDEFSVATPSFYAQQANGSAEAYSYYSDVINGSESDLFLGFRQPIRSILTVFRPFLLGYLFLPADHALAFYWWGRGILLFCISYEFGLFLTGTLPKRPGAAAVTQDAPHKSLALIYALLVTFAPVVQWWYTGTLAELTIYSETSLLLFAHCLDEKKFPKRIACYAGIFFSAGAFILCLYPAWQIPYLYLLLVMILWIALEHRKKHTLKPYDAVPIALGVIILVTAIIVVAHRSADTYQAIVGTVYPGERLETGGGNGQMLFTYGLNLIFSLTNKGFGTNICESAGVIDFFPLSVVIPLTWLFYGDVYKRKAAGGDLLLRLLLVVDLIFFLWITVGFPEWLS